MLQKHGCLTATLCVLSAMLAGCGGDDDKETVTEAEVLDPAEPHYGKTYAEWNTEWYKWIYGIQYDEDCHVPVDDSTGIYCDLGQSGDVFFLAGSFESDVAKVVRTKCVAPADTSLFFPLTNAVGDNGGVPIDMQLSDEENEAAIQELVDAVDVKNLFASVDGLNVPNLERFKVDATEFSYTLPDEPNFYTCSGGSGVTGLIEPSYAAGYYVMLPPLSKGDHTIRFGLDQPADLYTLDVTYKLTVE